MHLNSYFVYMRAILLMIINNTELNISRLFWIYIELSQCQIVLDI